MKARITTALAGAIATLTACVPASSGPATIVTDVTTIPGPTVTVTAPRPASASEPSDEQVQSLIDACGSLERIPPFDLLIDYEPTPDLQSVDKTLRVARQFELPSQEAIDAILATDAADTTLGAWVANEASNFRDTASQLAQAANAWKEAPTERNYRFWLQAFGYAIYEIQSTSSCLYVDEAYGN